MFNSVTCYLEYQTDCNPGKIAFIDEEKEITFSQLREIAYGISLYLIELGCIRKPIVVFLDKSIEAICSFYGVAYSDNFYVPIDIHMPRERISIILDQLNPVAVISIRQYYNVCDELFPGIEKIYLDDIKGLAKKNSIIEKRMNSIIDTDILYVLFTSGSTGVPKGVIISHRSAIDYVEWFRDEFKIGEGDVLGNQAPLHFDLSIQDVYLPAASGAKVVLIPSQLFSFPKKVLKLLLEKSVNTIVWVPTALCLVANLKALDSHNLPELKRVFFCGEVMPAKQLNMWRRKYPDTLFVNMYGPTETCDASTFFVIDCEFADDASIPIGKPCRNTRVLILDDDDNEVSGDKVGELCILGSSLSYGYYGDIKKTEFSFVQNPLNPFFKEIIYRTGDLVHYNREGNLEYVSRKDFQIKHLGYRIELGEIESISSVYKGVDMTCAIYYEEQDKILFSYAGAITIEEMRNLLKSKLPSYMIPDGVFRFDVLPINCNGKIDRIKIKETLIEKWKGRK